jgi:hypothetical protein
MGLRLPGVEPGTLLPLSGTCDSSPIWSEVTHFYDILIIYSKNISDLTQIRTEIPNLGQYGSKCASLLNFDERFLGASAKSIRYSA